MMDSAAAGAAQAQESARRAIVSQVAEAKPRDWETVGR